VKSQKQDNGFLLGRRGFLRKSILAAGLVTGARAVETIADEGYQRGRLQIFNYAHSNDFNIFVPLNVMHFSLGVEGYNTYDLAYSGGSLPPSGKLAGVVSVIHDIRDYRLEIDSRPLESMAPINLELFLHDISGEDVVVKNVRNELHVNFPNESRFGDKPITLWRRLKEGLQFLGDIKEACYKQEGLAVVPLPALDGPYESEKAYGKYQIRFDILPGDLNLDDIVNLEDLAMFANNLRDNNLLSDISGENGLPDGIVDRRDLVLFLRDWLQRVIR